VIVGGADISERSVKLGAEKRIHRSFALLRMTAALLNMRAGAFGVAEAAALSKPPILST
jgi:hypothetical protein